MNERWIQDNVYKDKSIMVQNATIESYFILVTF